MTSRIFLPLVLALVLGGFGCGPDGEITVQVDEAPVPPPPPAHAKSPAPPPPPPPPPPPRSVAAVPVSTPSTVPARGPHAVALFYEGPFFPKVEASLAPLDLPTGTSPIRDTLSKDGFGAAGRLGSLPAGRYQLRLDSMTAIALPLLDVEIMADGQQGTSAVVGWVSFRVPAKHSAVVGKGIALELSQLPPKRATALGNSITVELSQLTTSTPVFLGPLSAAAVVDAAGARHEASLLLPLGVYSFALHDLDEKDGVAIAASGGRPGLVTRDQNKFELTAGQKSTIVDITSALVLR